MSETKIVLIGVGSATFGQGMLSDAIHTPEIDGSTIVLVDIDKEKLGIMRKIADKMISESSANLKIEDTVERKEALQGAEFVVISIAINRMPLWRKDFEIPWRHGIRQVVGECGGPGGFIHTCRNIPIVLDICKDVEELCPKAIVLNFTNPENRLALAISKYTNLKAVGLCHGVFNILKYFSKVLDVPQ